MILNDWLDYDEQQTLEAILRFHEVEDPDLVKRLATFINWVRADEKAKSRLQGEQPPYLLVLLSQMGIWGKNALSPAAKKDS
jgi:hypothetical protein